MKDKKAKAKKTKNKKENKKKTRIILSVIVIVIVLICSLFTFHVYSCEKAVQEQCSMRYVDVSKKDIKFKSFDISTLDVYFTVDGVEESVDGEYVSNCNYTYGTHDGVYKRALRYYAYKTKD